MMVECLWCYGSYFPSVSDADEPENFCSSDCYEDYCADQEAINYLEDYEPDINDPNWGAN